MSLRDLRGSVAHPLRGSAAILLALWLLLATAQGVRIAATGSLMSGDAVYHFAHLHSLVIDRDLDPVNEVRYFRDDARSPYTGGPKISDRTTRHLLTGEVVNKYPLGLALLTLPAYVTVYWVALALASVGLAADVSGYGWTYQYACGLMVAGWAVAGLWVCQRIAGGQARVTASDAWWSTLLMAGATPWAFYTTLEPLFAHALSATAAAVLVWQWLRARLTTAPGPWVLTGVAAGVCGLIRYQDAALIALPLLDLALTRRTAASRAWLCGAVLCGAALGAAPQLAANAVRFGDPLTTGYFGESFIWWRSPHLVEALFSPEVGLLRWSPIVVAALAGLLAAARRGWPVARFGLAMIGLQIYLVASWYFVSQGHTFGNRMLVNCTVFFVVGLAALMATAAARPPLRRAIQVVGILLVGVNLWLMWLWTRGGIGPLADVLRG